MSLSDQDTCTIVIIDSRRASSNNEVKISTRAVRVQSVSGLDLFAGSDNPMNRFYLVIDSLKKLVHVVRHVVRPVW